MLPPKTNATPAPVKHKSKHKGSSKGGSNGGSKGGSGSQSKQRTTAPATLPVVQNTTTPVADTDTGTIPQGGIQAGAGGTAGEGIGPAILLGSAGLALVFMAGGLALRRRGLES